MPSYRGEMVCVLGAVFRLGRSWQHAGRKPPQSRGTTSAIRDKGVACVRVCAAVSSLLVELRGRLNNRIRMCGKS